MNTLPHSIIINLIEEWPILAFINKYVFNIYNKYVKNNGYVTVDYYLNPCNETLSSMCKKGKYIELLVNNLNWNWGLQGACIGGHLKIVNIMIEKGANNWNWGLYNACMGGNLNIVNLMIKMGANDWNLGLTGASKGGNLNLVNLMIERGANDWEWSLKSACEGGNLNVVNLLIKMGAKDWNLGLRTACVRDNIDIVNLMIEKGANYCGCCGNLKHKF